MWTDPEEKAAERSIPYGNLEHNPQTALLPAIAVWCKRPLCPQLGYRLACSTTSSVSCLSGEGLTLSFRAGHDLRKLTSRSLSLLGGSERCCVDTLRSLC